jgi:hypothetical protein
VAQGERVADRGATGDPAVLHLFAYTGLATLALSPRAPPSRTWTPPPDGDVGATTPISPPRRTGRSAGSSTMRWRSASVRSARPTLRRGRPRPTELRAWAGSSGLGIEDDLLALLATIAGLLEPDGFLLLTRAHAGLRWRPSGA